MASVWLEAKRTVPAMTAPSRPGTAGLGLTPEGERGNADELASCCPRPRAAIDRACWTGRMTAAQPRRPGAVSFTQCGARLSSPSWPQWVALTDPNGWACRTHADRRWQGCWGEGGAACGSGRITDPPGAGSEGWSGARTMV